MTKQTILPIWKYLLHLIRYAWGSYLVDLLLWVTLVLGPSLLNGLLIRAIFDHLTNHVTVSVGLWGAVSLSLPLPLLLVLLLVAAAVEMSLLIISEGIDILLRLNVSSLLRHNLFAHLLWRPTPRPLPDSPSEAVSRFRDDVKRVENLVSNTVSPLGQVVFMVAAVGIMLQINMLLTLVVFLPLVGMLFIASAARYRLQRYREAQQVAAGRVTGFLGEMLGAVQVIQLNTAEKSVLAAFGCLNERRGQTAVKDQTFTALLNALTGNTVSLGTGLILLLAAQSLANGRFTVGDFALFVYYLGVMAQNTDWVGYFIANYRQSAVSFARLQTLMGDAPPLQLVAPQPIYLRQAPPLPAWPAKQATDRLDLLTAEQISYRLGQQQTIHDMSFTLPRGSFTVITGRVGAGKTTLLRLLLGLLPADAGEIYWNGRLLTSPATFLTPPRCAYAGQQPRLFSGTLRDNILLGVPNEEVDWERVLETAVFAADVAQLADGLDTPIGPRGVKLSGGQAQRVAAARLLVRQPELLVVDDLSSGLDVATEQAFWTRLRQNGDGQTLLVVSQRQAVLAQADHILVLANGRLLDSGSLPDLLARSPEMQALWVKHQAASAQT